jgi:hypothetical protein
MRVALAIRRVSYYLANFGQGAAEELHTMKLQSFGSVQKSRSWPWPMFFKD